MKDQEKSLKYLDYLEKIGGTRNEKDIILPHSIINEEHLLGILLVNPNSIKVVEKSLNSESFYIPIHTVIFDYIKEVDKNNIQVSLLDLALKLKKSNNLIKVKALNILRAIIVKAKPLNQLEYLAEQISYDFIRRKLYKLSSDIQDKSLDEVSNIIDIINHFEYNFSLLTTSVFNGETNNIS